MRRSLLAAVLFSPLALIGQLSPSQQQANLAAFDYVWKTVQAKHWDPSMGGLDWAAVRAELRPRVEQAKSESEARAVIDDMLDRLHLSHFAVIPGTIYHDVANASDGSAESAAHGFDEGTSGIDVRVLDGLAVVTRVDSGSPAAKAGVRAGWTVVRVDGDEIAPVIGRVAATYAGSTMRDMMVARSVQSRLEGPVGNSVEIEFGDGRDRKLTLTLDREQPRGAPAKFGYLPESYFRFESRTIAGDIGYIGFNYFLDPAGLIPDLEHAIQNCGSCAGMMIDLRGNPGGIGVLATGVAGFFLEQPDLKLGTMYMRDLPLKFVVNPRSPGFRGPLAILVDGLSASTAEIFAGGMQDLKRARVFGSRTAGAALPSMIERLPNGDAFQYAAAAYKSESGKTLEGNGVTPDEPVAISRAALLSGHDPVIDAASQWIHQKASLNRGSTKHSE